MSKIFTTFPFNRVAKLEYPELINDVIAITDKYDPEALFINGMYVVLKQKQPLLKNLEVVYKKNIDTEVLKRFRSRREDLLKAILSQTKGLVKANVASQSESLKLVVPFVGKYFNNIISDNSKTRTERIRQMFINLDANADLKVALTSVGLNIYLDELRTLKISIDETQNLRRKVNSNRVRMKTNEIKVTISAALTNFLRSIEIAMIEHSNVDYSPLVNELNELFTNYSSDIKARKTRNKNAAEDTKNKTETDIAA